MKHFLNPLDDVTYMRYLVKSVWKGEATLTASVYHIQKGKSDLFSCPLQQVAIDATLAAIS